MSGGRFMLGLGANSPEFLAGFHGRPFPPASRHLRETIEVIRLVAAGRPLEYTGTVASFPSDGIPAVEMEPGLAQSFPIYIASLSPKSLQVTGAVADGWVGGASFAPSMAGLFREHIDRGAAGEGRSLATFDFMAPAFMPPDRERGLAIVKPFLASQLGRQGAFTYGFHPRVYLRAGMEGLVERITSLFAAGKPGEAAAQVPDELALERCLVGSDDDMRTTLRAYRDCGATTIETFAFRPKLTDSLEQLTRVKALLDDVSAEQAMTAGRRSS
jgi:alkanesulfonate monooxygenase SsuD/methylene tetrahydromethanopterin reductase-like flavin-dependent oxidoreductase (luciferase family)